MFKRFIPYAHANKIFDIDISFYKKLGVKYLFVDLDNTLDSYLMKTPSKEVKEFNKLLKCNGIEMIIVSNNTDKRVRTYAKELGVRFAPHVGKPFGFGLKKTIKKFKLNINEVMLVGDQTTTDISAANRAGIKCILTDKIVKEDQPTTRFNRLFDKPIRKSLAKKNLLRDWRTF